MILHKFKIYPEEKHYYRVLIFDTKKAMHEHYRKNGTPGVKLNFEGICHAYEIRLYKKDDSTEIIKDDIGFILLYKDGFGAGIVSHEITHATTYWCKVAGFCLNTSRFSTKQDERYAYALGNMVNQFWIKYYEKFPINEPSKRVPNGFARPKS